MSVKTISKDELRRMEGSEGLIIQGCGGSLDEWVDGINDMLTEDGILLDGTRFHDCSTFEHDGSTCLLFPFKDDVKLDVGRLAMWRLQTHGNFGGTWLSDYVPNRLGGFISKEQTAETAPKPDCPLIGQDGNIFNLMGIGLPCRWPFSFCPDTQQKHIRSLKYKGRGYKYADLNFFEKAVWVPLDFCTLFQACGNRSPFRQRDLCPTCHARRKGLLCCVIGSAMWRHTRDLRFRFHTTNRNQKGDHKNGNQFWR